MRSSYYIFSYYYYYVRIKKKTRTRNNIISENIISENLLISSNTVTLLPYIIYIIIIIIIILYTTIQLFLIIPLSLNLLKFRNLVHDVSSDAILTRFYTADIIIMMCNRDATTLPRQKVGGLANFAEFEAIIQCWTAGGLSPNIIV